jgi:hypothetical protein
LCQTGPTTSGDTRDNEARGERFGHRVECRYGRMRTLGSDTCDAAGAVVDAAHLDAGWLRPSSYSNLIDLVCEFMRLSRPKAT